MAGKQKAYVVNLLGIDNDSTLDSSQPPASQLRKAYLPNLFAPTLTPTSRTTQPRRTVNLRPSSKDIMSALGSLRRNSQPPVARSRPLQDIQPVPSQSLTTTTTDEIMSAVKNLRRSSLPRSSSITPTHPNNTIIRLTSSPRSPKRSPKLRSRSRSRSPRRSPSRSRSPRKRHRRRSSTSSSSSVSSASTTSSSVDDEALDMFEEKGQPYFANVNPNEQSNCKTGVPNRFVKPTAYVARGVNGRGIWVRDPGTSDQSPPKLLPHQEQVSRYLSSNESPSEYLVLHDTGTGKTAIMTHVIDNHLVFDNGKFQMKNPNFNKIIIIVPEHVLKDNVITEARKYSNGALKKLLEGTEKMKSTDIQATLRDNANIHFMTYAEAGKSVKQFVPPALDRRIAQFWDSKECDDIESENATKNCWFLGYVKYVERGWAVPQFFSNAVILLDEIHNIISPSEKFKGTEQYAPLTLKFFFLYRNVSSNLDGVFSLPTNQTIYRPKEIQTLASKGFRNLPVVSYNRDRYNLGKPNNIKFIGFTATPVMNGGQDLFTLVNIMKGNPKYVDSLNYVEPSSPPSPPFKRVHGEFLYFDDNGNILPKINPFEGRRLKNTGTLQNKLSGLFSVYRKEWDTTRFPLVSLYPIIHAFPYSKELENDLASQKVKYGSPSISNKGRAILRGIKGNIKSLLFQLTSQSVAGGNKIFMRKNNDCSYSIRNLQPSLPKNTPIYITGDLSLPTSAKFPKLSLRYDAPEPPIRDVFSFPDLIRKVGSNDVFGIQNRVFKHMSPKLLKFILWMSSTNTMRTSTSTNQIVSKGKHFAYAFNSITLEALALMLVRSGWTCFIPPKACFASSESSGVVSSIQINTTGPGQLTTRLVGVCRVFSNDILFKDYELNSHMNVFSFEEKLPISKLILELYDEYDDIEVILFNGEDKIWSETVSTKNRSKIRLYPRLASDEIQTFYNSMKPYPKRFMFLHDGMDPDIAKGFIDFFNHKSNTYGNYIHLIIMSSAFKEGITLKDVQNVHFIDCPTSMTEIVQALGRASRVCSFQNLPKSLWRVTWHIWMHVIKSELRSLPDPRSKNSKSLNIPFQSKELDIWMRAQRNYLFVSELNSFLEQVATDCSLHQGVSNVVCL